MSTMITPVQLKDIEIRYTVLGDPAATGRTLLDGDLAAAATRDEKAERKKQMR